MQSKLELSSSHKKYLKNHFSFFYKNIELKCINAYRTSFAVTFHKNTASFILDVCGHIFKTALLEISKVCSLDEKLGKNWA